MKWLPTLLQRGLAGLGIGRNLACGITTLNDVVTRAKFGLLFFV
jgi:hypothetical protein